MLHRNRKTRWHRSWAGVLALGVSVAVIAGCGSSSGTNTASGAKSADSSAKGFKVALVLPGSPSDHAYDQDGVATANAIKSKLGIPVTVVPSVSVPNAPNVYTQLANQGYKLVIGWGGQFSDAASAAATQSPNTQFLAVQGENSNGSNLSSVDEYTEQWRFIGGYIAGRLTKSNVVGYIAGQCFPSTAADLSGARQGVLYANPHAKFLSTYTGDFEDPTKAQQAATAMIGQGADVLFEELNNGIFGLVKAAQNSGGRAKLILLWSDNHSLAPSVIASDVLNSQASIVVPLVKKAQMGQLGGKHYQVSLPKDWGPAITKTALLPQSIYTAALNVQKKIADGTIKVQHNPTCSK